MKTLILGAAIAAACFATSACSSTGALVIQNANAQCDRHYNGSINAGMTGANFTGTFKADCIAANGAAASALAGSATTSAPTPTAVPAAVPAPAVTTPAK